MGLFILVGVFYVVGIFVCYTWIDRQKIITQQNQIQEDLKELKSLLEQEGYKDKEIKDKHFLDVEI